MSHLSMIVNPVINEMIGNIAGAGPRSFVSNSTGPIETLLRNFINIAFGAGGAIFFIYLLMGGFSYITAGGDKEAVQKANARIRTAVIGIAILLSVFVIAWLVQTLFGIPLLNFTVPNL